MSQFQKILRVFLLLLVGAGAAQAEVKEVRYCTVYKNNDSDPYESLRSTVEKGFNLNVEDGRECTERIDFDKNQDFDIHLTKTLYLNAWWDKNSDAGEPQGDQYNMVVEGHPANVPHTVEIHGDLLAPNQCVLKINADNVMIRRLRIWTYRLDKAICVENGFTVHSTADIRLYFDEDNDKILDKDDNCAKHKNPDQKDGDGDGVGDACDACPKDDNPDHQDSDHCYTPLPPMPGDFQPAPMPDGDEDGTPNLNDNCKELANPDQVDDDGDGIGDACDVCPSDPNPLHQKAHQCLNGTFGSKTPVDPGEDSDGDGVPNANDNCPSTPNPDQANSDGKGAGDACSYILIPPGGNGDTGDNSDDPNDQDGDGTPNDADNCPTIANPEQTNTDGDNYGDTCDPSPGTSAPPGSTPGVFEDVDPGTASACALSTQGTTKNSNWTLTLLSIALLTTTKLRISRRERAV